MSLDTEQVAPAQQRVAEYLEGAQLVASAGASMPKTPAKGLLHPGAQLSAEQYEATARLYAVVVSPWLPSLVLSKVTFCPDGPLMIGHCGCVLLQLGCVLSWQRHRPSLATARAQLIADQHEAAA